MQPREKRRFGSGVNAAFWVGLAVRLAYVAIAHTWRQRPWDDHFGFGWEMGRVARALATGYGYADPFRGHSGPTAWVTPLYPLLMAGVFRLTGVYTAASAWILLTLNCMFNTAVVFPLREIATRSGGERVARWTVWVWALYPAAMQYAVKWIWEMSLTVLLFTWAVLLALRMRERSTAGRWAWFGLVWGSIALSNPALLLFLPASGLWALWPALRRGQRAELPRQRDLPGIGSMAAGVLLGAVVFSATISPWVYRNWRAFHHFVPMRGNFGAELYLGNGPGATGLLMEYDHPAQAPDQLKLYKALGEIAYARMRGAMAQRAILRDPGHFAALTARRLYFFWFSVPHPADEGFVNEYGRNLNFQFTSIVGLLGLALALRRGLPGAWLYLWAFLLLPLMYYFVTVHARFRHPLEPLIAMLAVYLFQSAERKRAAAAD